MEMLNMAALALSVLLGVIGVPVLLRRAGFPWNKVVFGSLTALAVLLAASGVLSAVQNKTGLALPLGWLVPLAALVAVWRLPRQPS
jgi:hypothetical protein